MVCELDVLFLRPGNPGALLRHGGDIDNRIKVLLDSLRRPDDEGEIQNKEGDEPDPDPMYCVLQDDSLITKLSVTVDRLLLTDESLTESSAWL